jgi:TPR repeat protein
MVLALLAPLPAKAQDFEKGLAAYKRSDYATALAEWGPLARREHAAAQYHLGLMYEKGNGVRQSFSEAATWYRIAGKQGHGAAQYRLGFLYDTGQGVSQDYAKAVTWYRKAAEQGSAPARINLGGMYGTGRGVPQNHAEAVKWYWKAAEQGDATAQYNLGFMYAKGLGVPKDQTEATKWYRRAAKQGDANAKRSLRAMQKKSRGVATKNRGRKDKSRNDKARRDKRPVVVAKAPPMPARGGFHIQFSAVKSKALSVTEAARLTRIHKSVLGQLTVVPVRTDLGKRGIFYRLRAGPLRDRAAAESLCRKFAARKQGCIVIKP